MFARWLLGSTIAGVLFLHAQAGIGAELEVSRLLLAPVMEQRTETAPRLQAPPSSDRSKATLAVADSADAADTPPVYHPPQRGAPESRVSGASRGANVESSRVFVLAPKATGETMTPKPTLYWFVSDSARDKVEVTVTQNRVAAPLLDVTFDAPTHAGIFAFSLADANVALKPGTEYRWSVALVVDPAQRERDIVASGGIRYVEPSDALQQQLKNAPVVSWPAILAGASLWYDALGALAAEMAAEPTAKVLHAHRAALLDQVGLPEAAAFDRTL